MMAGFNIIIYYLNYSFYYAYYSLALSSKPAISYIIALARINKQSSLSHSHGRTNGSAHSHTRALISLLHLYGRLKPSVRNNDYLILSVSLLRYYHSNTRF